VTSLREAWEGQAQNWMAFATPDGPDHWFWELNWPAFESLLPSPGRATLDLGCGEGRVGVDADAAALPFADASFDLVVAFMSLQDVDDAAAALREAARVLDSDGRVALVIENLREPRPSEKHVAERPRWAEEARTPGVLHLLCGKP
jgi:16S rRNA G1207 methylase RsmC